jgi:hypothetical protein
METIEIKLNDVFSFRFNEAETKKRFDPYHCFDGTLIVKQSNDGGLYLEDTYWSSGENKSFTVSEALKLGVLTFKCNLDDVQKIEKHDLKYYNDEDIIHLHIHGGYRSQNFIMKGTERSKEAMISHLQGEIEESERLIKHHRGNIEWCNNKIKQIEAGDLTIYI